jgi:hypothetical protein
VLGEVVMRRPYLLLVSICIHSKSFSMRNTGGLGILYPRTFFYLRFHMTRISARKIRNLLFFNSIAYKKGQ